MVVGLGGGLQRVTLPSPGAELDRQVRRLRFLLEKRTTHQYRKPAQALYDALIRPLEPMLTAGRISPLVVVPDGVLRLIPCGALLRGKQFLVERYAVATSPGLGLIAPGPFPDGAPRTLSAGLTQGVQGFAALPHVASELRQVSTTLPGSTLVDGGFRKDALRQVLRRQPYQVVHIASHGVFEAQASDSFLLTYDGRIAMDELERLVGLTRFRAQPIELLTLSACQTAAGAARAALGLAGVAFKAGARSVVGTLWFINDEAASDVVTRFYEHLTVTGTSKAEALRRGQIAVREQIRFRHPYYWSAFLVIGNWL